MVVAMIVLLVVVVLLCRRMALADGRQTFRAIVSTKSFFPTTECMEEFTLFFIHQ
jgi:hypothetical protein